MNWYQEGVASAIQLAFSTGKIFLVYLEGDNDDSKRMDETWEHEEVQSCVKDTCVSVKVHSLREDGKQFATFYPVLLVPATYLINSSGVPVDIIPGYLEPEKFVERLNGTFQKIKEEASQSLSNQTTETPVSEPDTNKPVVNEPVLPKPNENGSILQEENASDNIEERLDSEQSTNQVPEDVKMDTAPSTAASTEASPTSSELPVEERIKIAEELLQERRDVKRQENETKEKEKEFKRRHEGQELSKARRERAEQQAINLASEIAKRKAEEKAAREAVREQIRRDRAEKNARFNAEEEARLQSKRKKKEEAEMASRAAEPTVCRLQFRYPDGTNVVRTFEPDSTLEAVSKQAVEDSKGLFTAVTLATIYPKHEFTDDELQKSVKDLGLMPSAVLVVLPGYSRTKDPVTVESNSVLSVVWLLLSPLILLLTWLKTLVFGDSQSSTSTTDTTATTKTETPRPQSSRGSRVTSDTTTYRRQGNIHKFTQNDDDDDDEENKTWNGNSTQQM